SDTIQAATDTSADAAAGRSGTTRSGALSTLRLPELQALAAELGVPRTSAMRKGELVTAIREHRAGATGAQDAGAKEAVTKSSAARRTKAEAASTDRPAPADRPEAADGGGRSAVADRTDGADPSDGSDRSDRADRSDSADRSGRA